MRTLHLTAEEKKVFDALSQALRDGWIVEEEKSTAYEENDVLGMRMEMASCRHDPHIQKLMQALQQGDALPPLPDLPDATMMEFFFCLGARGITAFIDTLLSDIKNDDDLLGLAYLTAIRRRMFQVNASTSPVTSS